ncbi:MAG: hypothetical protein A3H95_13710 [Acidobacteria bacterium RIFCSPLOWO2_02_FULL_64_15]|nr:MAG: hypothetical protein A3H95_13710 [Acidobacteria bacterium RIFCSPLOWO2_02_FULL_64_15]
MVKPRALGPGDRLAIVAPASPFSRDEFDRGVEELRALGFDPVYDDSVFAKARYLSGPADVRAAAIRRAWLDPSIAGVVAVRGGYGSAQVLPFLDRDEARHARKPFIGYSDLTSVLTFLTLGCELVAFHGPMLDRRLARGVRSRNDQRGRGERTDLWGYADTARVLARDAVRVCASGRLRAVSRRGRRATVPPRSHGDAASSSWVAGACGRRCDR